MEAGDGAMEGLESGALRPLAMDLSGMVGHGWVEAGQNVCSEVSQGGAVSKEQGQVAPYLHPFFIRVSLRPERVPLKGQPAGSDTAVCALAP